MAESVLASINTITKQLQGLTLTEVTPAGKKLGKGSYGKVFTVKYRGKTYAAKEIHSLLLEMASPREKQAIKDNFLKECYHCSTLRHPNIVQFIGVYYPNPQSFLPVMVMELMDIGLNDYIKARNIDMKLKITILCDISQGLNFLHCHTPPIIHRDLSPNNVLLSYELVAKISDLGMAKVVKDGTRGTKSKLTQAPGTADFMPPEALTDDPTYSTSLDIFSYGGVILHVVNQEWPTPTSATIFDPKSRQVKGFTEVERRQRYLDMMIVEAEVLKSLAKRCLDNDPAKRPAAANVLKELKDLKVQQEYKVINKNVKLSDDWILLLGECADMVDTSRYAILLDTTVGYKEPSWLKDAKDWVFGKQKQYSEKNVISGTLLEALSKKEILLLAKQFDPILNYKVLSSEHTFLLHCEPKQIKGLSYEEIKYLQAVKGFNDRLEALPKLDWIGSLTLGSGAHLNIPTVFSHPVKVTIRYIGNLPGPDRCGTYFGLELLECRGRGNTDGTFQDYRLFDCSSNCGCFVSMDKLVLCESGKQPMAHQPQPVVHQPQPQPQRQASVTDDKPFKRNDRVEVLDIKGVSEKGTVKWIGRNKEILPNGTYIVGIHTDRIIHDLKDRFPYQITSMIHYIENSKKHSRLVLPIYLVNKIEDQGDNGGTVSHGHKHGTQQNYSFNAHGWLEASAVADEGGISMVKEHKIEPLKKFEQRKETRREQETIQSNERRRQIQQIKNELQIGEIEGFDDIMLDPKRQEKILEDLKRQKKENQQNSNQRPQNMSSYYNPPQGMPNQGVPYHGMPQQDMQSQGVPQPGIPQPGIPQSGMPPQGTNMAHGYPYRQGMPQNYQTQPYNQPSNNGNWWSENLKSLYPVERQQSVEFHQILRAEANVSNDTSSSGYLPPEPHRQMEAPHNMPPLEVGDAIQCGNNLPHYGTIQWIGEIQGSKELIAGVEMEQPVAAGATDGWHDGNQYFVCEPGKGMFLRLGALRRDDRFIDVKNQTTGYSVPNPLGKFDLNSSIKSMRFIQPSDNVIEHVHTGGGKGIQGHQNSCYLDSTLYGLFAFSEAFDDLFLEEATDEIGMIIKSTLQSIVNTLRHNNVVLYDHIMILRDELDKLQHIKGLKSDKKDPEEFLNLLFMHVLKVEAFLKVKRPFGTDKEFFVQLFVEGNKHHIPNTQDLLTEMFNDQQITFAKYPLRLLLQIPRYGKKFRTFKGIIPSLELDVTTLCEQYVGKCMVCGKQGTEFCPDCGPGKQGKIKENASYFCKDCVALWHVHESRRYHKPVSKQSSSDGGDPGRLRLLSVLCIETSHYVCFTRVQGSGTNVWVFFDSMAERPDDVHNIPCVTQCTQELNEWVYGDKDLTNYTSKELPELVRRFVEDGYLCIYVDQDGIMYGDGGSP